MTRMDATRWNELSPLLDEALELSDADRAVWLETLRTTRPEVAVELEELLNELQSLDQAGFLQGDPSRMLGQPSLVGQTVGSYILESQIGHGGMGSVWLAHRTDGRLEGKVAVKLLNFALLGNSGGEERFRREGRLLSKLLHPNIARVLDAGLASTGQPYLVLEHVEGRPIDVYCDESRLDITQRLKLFLDVLAAVGHSHANLVIHRDLKPSNIFVTRAGAVKLLDFGIAKLIQEEEDEAFKVTNLTVAGSHALTPGYASPEQVLGETITTATDVYSLGVLLYVLLTGQHPTGAQDSSALQHVHRLIEVEPSRVSDAAMGARTRTPFTVEENAARRGSTPLKLRRVLQGDLDNIVSKALKKSALERYSSVAELSEDLQRFLRNEPVLARADNSWYRIRKFVIRNRFPVTLAATAVLAVLAAAGLALMEAHNANAARDKALALSSRNEAVAEFLNLLITEAAGSDKPIHLSEVLDRSEAMANGEYRKHPEQRAAVLDMLAGYYHSNGDDLRAESLIRDGLDSLSVTHDLDLRRKLTCDHAVLLEYVGKGADVAGILNGVLAESGIAPETASECLEYLSHVAMRSGDSVNALKFAKLGLSRLYENSAPTPTTEAAYLAMIADAEAADGRNDEAEKYYQRALDLLAEAGRERSPVAMTVLGSWAIMSESAGNPRRALELTERAMQIRALNDPGSAPAPFTVATKARALYVLGRVSEGRDTYAECISDTAPRIRIYCLSGLALTSNDLGQREAAESYIRQAFEAEATIVPTDTVMIARLRAIRGQVSLSEGRLADARHDLDGVLANTNNEAILMPALLTRSELNLAEGRYPAAAEDARRLLVLCQKSQGGIRYSNRTGLAWLALGRALLKQGQAAAAHRALQTAFEHLSNTVDPDHPLLKLARELAGT
jgi:serine/threonine protein kinase